MNKKKFLILFLFMNLVGFAQNSEKKQQVVDSLINIANAQLRDTEFEQVINTSFEIAGQSEQIGYEKGMIKGYSFIMYILAMSGDYEKSMEYLEKMKPYEKSYLKSDATERFLYYFDQSELYHLLGIPVQAVAYFKKAEAAIGDIKDVSKRNESMFYLSVNSQFYSSNPDTNYVYLLRAQSFLKDSAFKQGKKEDRILSEALLNMLIGGYFTEKLMPDTAISYYNVAKSLLASIGGHYLEGGVHKGLGSAYKDKKDFATASAHNAKALHIFQKYNSGEDIRDIYANMAELYRISGDDNKKNEYLALSAYLTDSLEQHKKLGRSKNFLLLIKEKEAAISQTRTQHRNTIILICIGGLLSFSGLYLLFLRYRKKKNSLLVEKETLVHRGEQELKKKSDENLLLLQEIEKSTKTIEQQEQEKQVLEQKMNLSFEEVIKMAKENDPLFWKRFQEVYPGFLSKMLTANSQLRNSELMLCAYIYLGFTTREFAEYTFKSAKTVENYRYTLRKKLNLVNTDNLNLWIQNYIDE